MTAAATSERMSPKVFSITSTSKLSGSVTICIATESTRPCSQLDVGVVGRDLGDDAPPHARRLEHVRLVDREQPAAAGAGQLERAPRDPLDLRRVVLERVEDGAVVADAARAVVEAADQLAHDQQVDAVGDRGAQVREDVELAAEADQARLGPHAPAVPLRAADRAEQHGVGRAAGGERLRRQRVADRVDRGAAERVLLDRRRRAAALRARAPRRPSPRARCRRRAGRRCG